MPEPKVVVGLWGLLGTGLAIVVTLGGLVLLLLDNVRDDIAAIRSDIDSLEQKADDTILTENSKEAEVRKNLGDLVADLSLASDRLDRASEDVTRLNATVDRISLDLANLTIRFDRADVRQAYFETFVVAQLGTPSERLPSEWNEMTNSIVPELIERGNPIAGWADRATREGAPTDQPK